MLYVAHPYWHVDPLVRDARMVEVKAAVKALLSQGQLPYAPCIYGHALDPDEAAASPEAWRAFALSILRQTAMGVLVLPFEGWLDSRGLASELALARVARLPIYAPDSFALPCPSIADPSAWAGSERMFRGPINTLFGVKS